MQVPAKNWTTPSLTGDQLTMYFVLAEEGKIRKARRTTLQSAWVDTGLVHELNSDTPDKRDSTPRVSADGRAIWFRSERSSIGGSDVYYAEWEDDKWGIPVNVSELNTPALEGQFTFTTDLLTGVFESSRECGVGQFDLWVTTRSTVTDPWDPPLNLRALNSTIDAQDPALSPDGSEIWFSSNRPGGLGNFDLWTSRLNENWLKDTDGNSLNGELFGELPSGDAEAGGSFVAEFRLIQVGADFDWDGDVDDHDFQFFSFCGRGSQISYPPACAAADLDSDGDVDQSDFGVFQRCWSGLGVPLALNCAD